MSLELSNAASTQFDSEVKHAYQGMGKLLGTVTTRNGVTGDTYKFEKMGKGLATERTAPSSDVTPMDITHIRPSATLTDWEAPEYTDIYNKAEVNFDEVQQLAQTISKALARRRDQFCIDAMATGTYSATPAATEGGLVGTDVGGVGSDLNVDKLRAAQKFFDDLEIDESERFFVMSSSGKASLLAETEVTSSDYANVKNLVNGDVDTFLGFKFITLGSRGEGGLPKAGAVRDSFAYHRSAVGEAIGIDMKTRVDYVPQKSSWLSNGILKGGATIIDNEGIVKIQCTEA